MTDQRQGMFPSHIPEVRERIRRTTSQLKPFPFWDKTQIRSFVNDVKHEFGPGWNVVGSRVQKAFLAEQALRVIVLQRSDVPMAAVRQLLPAMLEEAGL